MGHVDTYGCTSGWNYYGVRPAMYLDLSAGGWTNAGTVSGKITATETEEDNKVSGEVTVTYNPQMKKLKKMEITENHSGRYSKLFGTKSKLFIYNIYEQYWNLSERFFDGISNFQRKGAARTYRSVCGGNCSFLRLS